MEQNNDDQPGSRNDESAGRDAKHRRLTKHWRTGIDGGVGRDGAEAGVSEEEKDRNEEQTKEDKVDEEEKNDDGGGGGASSPGCNRNLYAKSSLVKKTLSWAHC